MTQPAPTYQMRQAIARAELIAAGMQENVAQVADCLEIGGAPVVEIQAIIARLDDVIGELYRTCADARHQLTR